MSVWSFEFSLYAPASVESRSRRSWRKKHYVDLGYSQDTDTCNKGLKRVTYIKYDVTIVVWKLDGDQLRKTLFLFYGSVTLVCPSLLIYFCRSVLELRSLCTLKFD